MPTAVLGVDLAARRWRDNGSALLRFDAGGWLDAVVPAIAWRDDVPLTASELARRIDEHARAAGAAAVALDGPQGWRHPDRRPAEGAGRACERAARTQGKTGVRGTVYPATQRRWFELAIATFAELLARPGVALANDPRAVPMRPPAGGYVLVESFPTSTWRAAALTPLPGKRRAGAVRPFAETLARAFGLPAAVAAAGHDDLQASAAALAAAGVVGGPVRAIAHGVPAEHRDGALVEGLIWDAAPVASGRPQTPAGPVLVLVNGPPAAGKTSLARMLSRELSLPLLSKDDLKESLFDSLGVGDRAWSRRLGVATFALLYVLVERQLEAGRSVILEANFDAEHACPRLVEMRARHPFRLVEVHLSAPDDVLRTRFAQRSAGRERHPGHLDDVVARELDAGEHRGRWAPLPCADALVAVDATTVGATTFRHAVETVARVLADGDYARAP